MTILPTNREISPGREAFQRLAQQFAKAQRQAATGNFGRGGAGGSGGPGGAKGFLAGSGLLVALAVGGIAINQSLFNGMFRFKGSIRLYAYSLTSRFCSRWWSPSYQVHEVEWYQLHNLPRRNTLCGMFASYP